jgi:Flp pilus assembly protein TadG
MTAGRPGRLCRPDAIDGSIRENRRWREATGSVTAEFAVALPAVIVVLACCLGAVQIASHQVRLSDAAADAARTLARGDSIGVVEARAQRVAGTVELTTSTSGDFICVELSASAGPAVLAGLRIRASGCALAGGL